jgi:hypothetical protein
VKLDRRAQGNKKRPSRVRSRRQVFQRARIPKGTGVTGSPPHPPSPPRPARPTPGHQARRPQPLSGSEPRPPATRARPPILRQSDRPPGGEVFQWELSEHADNTELIVSELVANAILHGEGQIGVRISYDGTQLRVEVHDDGAGRPVQHPATAEAESGRGLKLVDGLLGAGGTRGVTDDDAGDGKTVYVAIPLAGTR